MRVNYDDGHQRVNRGADDCYSWSNQKDEPEKRGTSHHHPSVVVRKEQEGPASGEMNAFNNSQEEAAECPLCMEPIEVDDLNFYPCTCGYQICRFCWHRIRTDENELCPACRKAYPENPADFTPLSQEQVRLEGVNGEIRVNYI